MDLTIIVAVSENNVIGKQGKVPWYLKEDIKRFRTLTLGHSIIMGRKTYESLPDKFKPLPGRKNVVLSTTLVPQEGLYVARTLSKAIKETEHEDTYIIGGRVVYESFLPLATTLELTRIHSFFEGDTFFPDIIWDEWNLSCEEKKNGRDFNYSFLTYLRK